MAWRKRQDGFIKDESGAVAATYALALIGLVAIAGVAFDYARLATMDSELQKAADQAALAAATQLDGSSNAISYATSAASNLVSNSTLLANDGSGPAVTVDTLTFYSDYSDGSGTVTTDPTKANYVNVKVAARKAFYAFTPIVAAISSGDIAAAATAGLGSAICKEPPLFVCNPSSNPATIDVNALIGHGVVMKQKSGSWEGGNWGYLETGIGSGASALSKAMAYVTPPGNCVSIDDPYTEPGQKISVTPDFNTRFDIYNSGDSIGCFADGTCPPSDNSRKDVVQEGTATPKTKQECSDSSSGKGWIISPNPYRPTDASLCKDKPCRADETAGYPDAMGYPRDLCHAFADDTSGMTGGCGRFGDGQWDIDAYWQVNYGVAWSGQVSTSVSGRSYPTRYEVYEWERNNAASSYRDFDVTDAKGKTTTYRDWHDAVCSPPGLAPGGSVADRRVLPIAVVDCTKLGSGKTQVTPVDWMDVFLVEPSLDRTGPNGKYTSTGDFYGEVIGRTGQGAGGAASQFIRRDKPYLLD